MSSLRRPGAIFVSAALLAFATAIGAQAAPEPEAEPPTQLVQSAVPSVEKSAVPAAEKPANPAAEKGESAAQAPAADKSARPAETAAPVAQKQSAARRRVASRPATRPLRTVRRDVYRIVSRYQPPPVRPCVWCGHVLIIGIAY